MSNWKLSLVDSKTTTIEFCLADNRDGCHRFKFQVTDGQITIPLELVGEADRLVLCGSQDPNLDLNPDPSPANPQTANGLIVQLYKNGIATPIYDRDFVNPETHLLRQ